MTVVARYFFAEQADESAVLRTLTEGTRYVVRHDTATDTYVVEHATEATR